jgi:DNA polymerase III subunit beta
MNFTVNKSNLVEGLSKVSSVASSKNTVAMLSNCVFRFGQSDVFVEATDNDTSIRYNIGKHELTEWTDFLVNPSKLLQIVKEFPSDNIELDVDESFQINLRSLSGKIKGKYKLVGQGIESFPSFPNIDKGIDIELEGSALKRLIENVVFAAAIDTIKPSFNGICLSSTSGVLTLVASDSRRLSIASENVGCADFESIIIPLRSIQDILKMLDSNTVKFSISGTMIGVSTGTMMFVTRLTDGSFPDFQKIIPKDTQCFFTCDADDLRSAIKRVGVFSKEPSFKIIVDIKVNCVALSSSTAELGEGSEDVSGELVGTELKFSANSRYILDAIKMKTGKIKINATGSMNPVSIQSLSEDDVLSVIMPMQIKSV